MELYSALKEFVVKATKASEEASNEREALLAKVASLEIELSHLHQELGGAEEYIQELEAALDTYEVGIRTG